MQVFFQLMKQLESVIEEGHCAMTTDMWTDDFRKLSYLSLTIHYIDHDWVLHDRVLCTRHFEERKTGENIHLEVSFYSAL